MNADVQRYLDAVPEARKSMFFKIHTLITPLYPDATVDMHYGMSTYRMGEGWVALANQKHYVSLYTCGPQHLAAFKRDHPTIKTGKGGINFKPFDSIPESALKQVVRNAMEDPK